MPLDLGKIRCLVVVKEHDLVVLLALLVSQIQTLQIVLSLGQCDLIRKINVDFNFHKSNIPCNSFKFLGTSESIGLGVFNCLAHLIFRPVG